jgi:hypothetical protein
VVEAWQRSELTDVTAKVVIYEAFVEGRLEAPKYLARTVHDLYFEPKYEEFRPGVDPYCRHCNLASTQLGTIQWLDPDAFVSAVDPSTGACIGGDNPLNCQFVIRVGISFAAPIFFWSDLYLTKWFPVTEHVKLRFDAQFFNVLNHPNFGLPSMTLAGIPGNPSTQTGFGALTYTTSPPTGLLGVGVGGDSSPRMIAFQARLEF